MVEFDPEDNLIVRLLKSLVYPIQSIEDTFQTLRTERWLESAVGTQLDVIGKIVGQPRDGLDDDEYRRFIRARISTNRSDGTLGDILLIAELVINDDTTSLIIENQGDGAYVLRIEDRETTDLESNIVIRFLNDATSGGVRAILESGISDESEWFTLDVGPGLDEGHFIDARDVALGAYATWNGVPDTAGFDATDSTSSTTLDDWQATFTTSTFGTDGNDITISFGFKDGPDEVEVRDDEFFDPGTSLWTSMPNNVGVRVSFVPPADPDELTYKEIEDAINADSALVFVTARDPDSATKFVRGSMDGELRTGVFSGGRD